MRQKSDRSKLREKRGIFLNGEYEAWLKANEAKSTGTASLIHDPVSGRSVSVLSSGEKKVFWTIRFMKEVDEILEQFPLNKELVDEICDDLGVRRYSNILSTDFLVIKKDGTGVAISVKKDRSFLEGRTERDKTTIIRQKVEQEYWERRDILFLPVYSDEIPMIMSVNIQDVMRYWNPNMAVDDVSRVKHLIARGVIGIPMNKKIRYGDLARDPEVKRLFREYYGEQ